MRRKRTDIDEVQQMDLRPATPRHGAAPRQAEVAFPGDVPSDAVATALLTSLGRIQLDLDLVLRRLDRIEALLGDVPAADEPANEDGGPQS